VGLEAKVPKLNLYFGRVHLLLLQLIPVFHYYFVAPLVLGSISRVIPSWVFTANSFVGARKEEDGSEILQEKKFPFLAHTN